MKFTVLAGLVFTALPIGLQAEQAPCNLSEAELNGWFTDEIIGEWNLTYQGGTMVIQGMTMPIKPQDPDTATFYKVGDDLVVENNQGDVVKMSFITDRNLRFEPDSEDDVLALSDEDIRLAAGCGDDGRLPQIHYSGEFSDGGANFSYDAYLIFATTSHFLGIVNAEMSSPDGNGTIKQAFWGRQAS